MILTRKECRNVNIFYYLGSFFIDNYVFSSLYLQTMDILEKSIMLSRSIHLLGKAKMELEQTEKKIITIYMCVQSTLARYFLIFRCLSSIIWFNGKPYIWTQPPDVSFFLSSLSLYSSILDVDGEMFHIFVLLCISLRSNSIMKSVSFLEKDTNKQQRTSLVKFYFVFFTQLLSYCTSSDMYPK